MKIFPLHDSLSKGKEVHDHIHGLPIGLLYIAEESGKIHGRILGHLHLTYQGASALSGQAFN
jgi:hypothetical protein